MNWVKKQKLPAIKAIQFNGQPCIKLNNLWNALHESFNLAQNCQINPSLLDKISNKKIHLWALFSKGKLKHAIDKCNNSSASGPDKLS